MYHNPIMEKFVTHRRNFMIFASLVVAGGGIPLETHSETAILSRGGLAAPTAPQGASGGWPVYGPQGRSGLSGASGINLQDVIDKTKLFRFVSIENGGRGCWMIERSEFVSGDFGLLSHYLPAEVYVVC
jgi:hypothetical protein